MKVILETARLQFRHYTIDDLEFLQRMTNNPAVMRYIAEGQPWAQERTRDWLTALMDRYRVNTQSGLMPAIRKTDNTPVGHAGLISQVVEGQHETEIGYWIDEPLWGHGYATEAAMAWKTYARNRLGKRRLVSLIHPENQGSIHVAEKCGMTFDREVEFRGRRVLLYSQNT